MTVGLVAAGVVAAPVAQAAPAPEFTPAPVEWGPCAAERLATAECGFVEVPPDYDDPTGATVKVAVSRVLHTVAEADSQGVILVNPGGPGASVLGRSLLGGAIPNGVGASDDWIACDPRGVGSSEPALSCIPDYAGYNRPDFQPEAGTEQVWLERSEAYANACAENGGALLDNLTSVDNVRDMDNIRKALGREQINYYGFSYGTYLGQVYSSLFPDRVRRIVLDGVVDTREIWYESNLGQDIAFETNIKVYFDWIAKVRRRLRPGRLRRGRRGARLLHAGRAARGALGAGAGSPGDLRANGTSLLFRSPRTATLFRSRDGGGVVGRSPAAR